MRKLRTVRKLKKPRKARKVFSSYHAVNCSVNCDESEPAGGAWVMVVVIVKVIIVRKTIFMMVMMRAIVRPRVVLPGTAPGCSQKETQLIMTRREVGM